MFTFKDFDFLTDGEIDLKIVEKYPGNTEKGYVPSYKYHITKHGENIAIGKIDIRIGDNEKIVYGGHLGYEIEKKFRGNGYAAKAGKLIKQVARAHGMKKLIISCDPKNYPSRRTCEKLGARLELIVPIPSTHELYQRGERKACIYILELNGARQQHS